MNELEAMFTWWNQAITEKDGFTQEPFEKYFTPDAAIIANAKERVRGTKNMVTHFRRIQAEIDSVKIVLPFDEGFQAGNKIFTYHRIASVNNGVASESRVMGYAIIENGRIALVNFLSYEGNGQ